MSEESSEESIIMEVEAEGSYDEEEEEVKEEEQKAEEEEEEIETEEKLVELKLQRKTVHQIPESPKKLTKERAAECLTMLGKTGNAIEYAYLKIEAINLNLNNISIIKAFKYLEFVDVSQNHLATEDLHCLAELKNLVMIKADGNIVKTLDFQLMPFLQVLILSNNQIETTKGLNQPMLESLNLNHNLIKQAEDLDSIHFEHLKHLELRGNALTTTSGISIVNLRSLYLAENLINRVEGLHVLVNLQRLHLRDNRLVKLDGFSNKMEKLNYLNIRNNKIEDVMEVKKLNVLPALETVVLLENPFTMETEEEYRVEVLVHLPKLKRIDKDPIQDDEIEEAQERRADRDELGGEEEEQDNEEVGSITESVDTN